MKWIAALCLCTGFFLQAHGQHPVETEVMFSTGFILPHTPGIEHLAVSHPSMVGLSVYRKAYGEKPWQSRYNYPDVGAMLLYLNYKNPAMGKSIALIPNYKFHFTHPEKILNGHFRIGLGPAYHTTPYDKEDNNKNHALGSSFSYGIILGAEISARLNTRITLSTGLSLTNFSNGSIKKPNTGVNVLSWTSGLRYTFGEIPKIYLKDTTEALYSGNWRFTTVLTTGMSETLKIRTGSYPFFNIQMAADKQLDQKRRVSAGIEYFHTISLREEIKNDYWLEGETPDFKRMAIVVGYEQLFNRLSAIGQAGYYIYSPYKPFDPFYVRIGLRYALTTHILAGVGVKSHYFKAEAAEWSVGYRF